MAATPPARARLGRETPRRLIRFLASVEDVVYLAVALSLIGIAIAALYNTISDLVSSSGPFAQTVTNAVSGVLFVVIVLEIFRTLVAHLEGGGFQLLPFLVIGIISAVRHLLLVGALSVSNGNSAFNHAQIELGVNAGVALILVIALVLVYRSGMSSADEGE
jgi:uncharacterized membrane protein (DUF373 family)